MDNRGEVSMLEQLMVQTGGITAFVGGSNYDSSSPASSELNGDYSSVSSSLNGSSTTETDFSSAAKMTPPFSDEETNTPEGQQSSKTRLNSDTLAFSGLDAEVSSIGAGVSSNDQNSLDMFNISSFNTTNNSDILVPATQAPTAEQAIITVPESTDSIIPDSSFEDSRCQESADNSQNYSEGDYSEEQILVPGTQFPRESRNSRISTNSSEPSTIQCSEDEGEGEGNRDVDSRASDISEVSAGGFRNSTFTVSPSPMKLAVRDFFGRTDKQSGGKEGGEPHLNGIPEESPGHTFVMTVSQKTPRGGGNATFPADGSDNVIAGESLDLKRKEEETSANSKTLGNVQEEDLPPLVAEHEQEKLENSEMFLEIPEDILAKNCEVPKDSFIMQNTKILDSTVKSSDTVQSDPLAEVKEFLQSVDSSGNGESPMEDLPILSQIGSDEKSEEIRELNENIMKENDKNPEDRGISENSIPAKQTDQSPEKNPCNEIVETEKIPRKIQLPTSPRKGKTPYAEPTPPPIKSIPPPKLSTNYSSTSEDEEPQREPSSKKTPTRVYTKRGRDTKADREALFETENPRPTTSAALIRHNARDSKKKKIILPPTPEPKRAGAGRTTSKRLAPVAAPPAPSPEKKAREGRPRGRPKLRKENGNSGENAKEKPKKSDENQENSKDNRSKSKEAQENSKENKLKPKENQKKTKENQAQSKKNQENSKEDQENLENQAEILAIVPGAPIQKTEETPVGSAVEEDSVIILDESDGNLQGEGENLESGENKQEENSGKSEENYGKPRENSEKPEENHRKSPDFVQEPEIRKGKKKTTAQNKIPAKPVAKVDNRPPLPSPISPPAPEAFKFLTPEPKAPVIFPEVQKPEKPESSEDDGSNSDAPPTLVPGNDDQFSGAAVMPKLQRSLKRKAAPKGKQRKKSANEDNNVLLEALENEVSEKYDNNKESENEVARAESDCSADLKNDKIGETEKDLPAAESQEEIQENDPEVFQSATDEEAEPVGEELGARLTEKEKFEEEEGEEKEDEEEEPCASESSASETTKKDSKPASSKLRSNKNGKARRKILTGKSNSTARKRNNNVQPCTTKETTTSSPTSYNPNIAPVVTESPAARSPTNAQNVQLQSKPVVVLESVPLSPEESLNLRTNRRQQPQQHNSRPAPRNINSNFPSATSSSSQQINNTASPAKKSKIVLTEEPDKIPNSKNPVKTMVFQSATSSAPLERPRRERRNFPLVVIEDSTDSSEEGSANSEDDSGDSSDALKGRTRLARGNKFKRPATPAAKLPARNRGKVVKADEIRGESEKALENSNGMTGNSKKVREDTTARAEKPEIVREDLTESEGKSGKGPEKTKKMAGESKKVLAESKNKKGNLGDKRTPRGKRKMAAESAKYSSPTAYLPPTPLKNNSSKNSQINCNNNVKLEGKFENSEEEEGEDEEIPVVEKKRIKKSAAAASLSSAAAGAAAPSKIKRGIKEKTPSSPIEDSVRRSRRERRPTRLGEGFVPFM